MKAEAGRLRLAWPRHLLLLGLAMAALLLLDARDLAAIVATWARTGAFHHCFLIPPILVWLVCQRRDAVRRLVPEYWMAGTIPATLGGVLWLAGAAGHVQVARQAGLVVTALGLVTALLGRPVSRALRFPLLFALFLIPAGSEAEPWLQRATAQIAVTLLHAAGTSARLEGVFIETPAGLFRVAEACSGTGFLLAMAAYALLVCVMCFRSKVRQTLFFASAMVAALLANGLRAFAVMEIANRTSIRNPVVADHILYGWLLFAAVLGLLIWIASRWFDRDPQVRPVDARGGQGLARRRGAAPVLALLAIALLGPRLWLAASEPGAAPHLLPPAPPPVVGWTQVAEDHRGEWHPYFRGATWIGQWRYVDARRRPLDLALILYDRQTEDWQIATFGQGAAAERGDWTPVADVPALQYGRGEWIRGSDGRMRYAVTWYLVDGTVTGSRARAKVAAALARLTGGEQRARAVILSSDAPDGAHIVADFLRAAGSAEEMADRARPIG